MRIITLLFSLIALISVSEISIAGTPVNSIAGFDLFGFKASDMDQNLGKRGETLGKALTATFPKSFQVEYFHENNYSGRCFVDASHNYRLWWMDSETEGFRFQVDRLNDPKTCVSPSSETQSYKIERLNASQFFPISRSNTDLQLGVTTPAQIQKELGHPAFSSNAKLVYVLKRDREKEKGCGGVKTSQGEFDAIDVVFGFINGVLESVTLQNSIAGEC